jgi:pyruvate-formate lyase-activating enzyme
MTRLNLKPPCLVASDGSGRVFEIPELHASAMQLSDFIQPEAQDFIPMPHGSTLFELPARKPVGYDPATGKMVVVHEYHGRPVTAVAAFLAPAYTQLYHPAFMAEPGAVRLPLFAYSAIGWRRNRFCAPAIRVDADRRQDINQFDQPLIKRRAHAMLKKFPANRLIAHLIENCVLRYHCPAAQNLVMGRWEAPIPTSPQCNAHCLGCISYQPRGIVAATQDRLDFVPTVEEIVAYTVPHLEHAKRAVVSFGQGCEGEPLLQGELLADTIREIRRHTHKGIINLNTNASRPDTIEKLCQAGLDSIRVSLNSSQPALYQKYFSPTHYRFEDVCQSLAIVRKHSRWISLNYFIFPGFTDHAEEMAALLPLLRQHRVNFIQMRNLNIDPEWYIAKLGLQRLTGKAIGIKKWMAQIKTRAPFVHFGYFNPPKEVMRRLAAAGSAH